MKIFAFIVSISLLLYPDLLKAQCPNSYAINLTKPSCQGSNNGQLSLSQTTYYSGSTFSWSNGSSSRNQYALFPGHYSVTVTDPTNCTYTSTTYLPASPTGLVLNPSFNPCSGFLYSGLSWPYDYPVSYQWSDGSLENRIIDPVPGSYSVTVTDASGCAGTTSYTVLPYSKITVSNTSNPASCTSSNGSIDLTVNGGIPPYSYQWFDEASGQTTQNAVNVPAGITRVRVSDASNCTLLYDASNSGPSIQFVKTKTSCGLNNASVSAQIQSMNNPSFLWSNAATTASISALGTGYYSLTVSDATCILSDSVYINNGGYMYININDSSVYNGCSVDVLEARAWNGASSDYQFLWNTGQTTNVISTISGLSNYSLTVTDANGCTATESYTLVSNGSMIFSSVVQDATCGNADGAIDMTLNNPILSYFWTPTGATTEDLSGLSAGLHVLQVSTSAGCFYSDTVAVGEFIVFDHTDASCGLTNGTVFVQDYGMTNPSFLWSNGATSNSLSNLAAGDYFITVTNGTCVVVDTLSILDAGQMTASVVASSGCQPDNITAIPVGGSAPFSYAWNNGSTLNAVIDPMPGYYYYVSITDANGCSDSASMGVPNPPLFGATYSVVDASCNNKNGAIYLSVTGGSLPMQYSWSLGGGNVKDLYGIWPGQYSVNIIDNNGCQVSLSNMVVGGQTNVNVSKLISQVNASNTGGAIDITVNGVSNPSFLWSIGATTEDITNLSSGYYAVSITDNTTNCVFRRNYYIPPPYVGNPNIKITGYVYDVSATATCSPGLALPYEMLRLQPLGLTAFTDINGKYEFNIVTPGNYTVEYINTAPLSTTVICPVGGVASITNAQQGNFFSRSFYLSNPPNQDLKVALWDYSLASPGFPYFNRIEFCNKGNTIMNGMVEYDYNSLLGFQSITGYGSTLTLHDIPNHLFNWSFSNLMPGDCRQVDVKFTVPTSASLGTLLTGTSTVSPTVGDASPANNVSVEQTSIVGSWDPNDKQVAPYHSGDAWTGGVIYEQEEELDYLIRFQNTGTAAAQFVIIRDTLDINLIPETIRSISTKHAVEVSLEGGNILVFTFNNIYLPDSSTDFEASIGFARFKIKRIAGLPVGTQIPNTAAIYFDYNAAVITNTPISVIDANSAVIDLDNKNLEATVMPNPFERQFVLKYTLQQATTVHIRIYNGLGLEVYRIPGHYQAAGLYIEPVQLADMPQGFYLIQIETEEGQFLKKVLKRD